ncbi:MAG: matrixin family metalloprotease [Myxococcales bacterium]|nr:matrixin family metalloprotease [Myxococcales bacterium]
MKTMINAILIVAAVLISATMAAPQARAWAPLYNCNSAWPNQDLPVRYMVNQDGVTVLTIDQVRTIFENSFGEWSRPCCSDFDATDGGLTTAGGENTRDTINALSFFDENRGESWPNELGDVNTTLGVTIPLVSQSCVIVSADVVFNNVGFNFIDGSPGRFSNDADLQSIATHEFGHFLGLDHSTIQDATMYAAYVGGTGARSLHGDDEDGVCTLYPRSCTCSSSSECDDGESCLNGTCIVPPCQSESDCDDGLICSAGDCVVPPCESDNDCNASHICEQGTCIPDANCPVCSQGCTGNSECGPSGVCIPAGILSEQSVCSSWCNAPSDCPGNSDCFSLPTQDGSVVNLCFNDDADVAGACPSDYVCNDPTADPCYNVNCDAGQSCNRATGQCQADPDTGSGNQGTGNQPTAACTVCQACTPGDNTCGSGQCIDFSTGQTVCSTPCGAGGTCPGDSVCFTLGGGGSEQAWCLNPDAASAGVCGGGYTCQEALDSTLCDGVTCGLGEACNPHNGQCEMDLGQGGGGGSGCSSTGADGSALGLLLTAFALALTRVRRRR